MSSVCSHSPGFPSLYPHMFKISGPIPELLNHNLHFNTIPLILHMHPNYDKHSYKTHQVHFPAPPPTDKISEPKLMPHSSVYGWLLVGSVFLKTKNWSQMLGFDLSQPLSFPPFFLPICSLSGNEVITQRNRTESKFLG